MFLKEVNDDNKILKCLDIRDKNFEYLRSAIALDKIDLECAENVKAKPTGNDSGFIAYSNTINVAIKSLYKSVYLITQRCFKYWEEQKFIKI